MFKRWDLATDIGYVVITAIVNLAKEEIDELPVPTEAAHWTTTFCLCLKLTTGLHGEWTTKQLYLYYTYMYMDAKRLHWICLFWMKHIIIIETYDCGDLDFWVNADICMWPTTESVCQNFFWFALTSADRAGDRSLIYFLNFGTLIREGLGSCPVPLYHLLQCTS